MKKKRFRWFGYVIRRDESEALRMVMKINVVGNSGKESSKKKWLDTIENDMMIVSVREDDVKDQVK